MVRDEPAETRAALSAARARNPGSAELMIAEGELERLEGNAQAATDAYRAALATAPESARAWHGLGAVQTGREDVKNARESLNKAIALDPQGTGFRGELGTLEAFADNLKAARAAFEQALEQQADDYVALTGLGYVELKTGNTDQAVARLLAATLIEPRYARAQIYLGVAYYQLGRTKDALFALNRARELDSKDPMPDMFESIIQNDRLRPGDALAAARRALSLMPFLKSLNQIANDQKGSANVGSALAAFGLEDWARTYAQDSYYPFWAGSHLFLADRYSGAFNKKSELFQGFLSDPTVFGASNRFSTLVPRPGNYLNLGGRYNTSRDGRISEPTITANGYANSLMPLAYFVEGIRTELRPDRVNFAATANTVTLALGARPTYELGLFAYANLFDATKVDISPLAGLEQSLPGKAERLDLGATYRFGPQSQAWLKIGIGNESSTLHQVATGTVHTDQVYYTDLALQPRQRDIQFRHTFAVNAEHELSWGAEFGRLQTLRELLDEQLLHPVVIPAWMSIPVDHTVENSLDLSRDIWISDRFRVNQRLILQGDLAWQHYSQSRSVNATLSEILGSGGTTYTSVTSEGSDRSTLGARLGASQALGNGATLRGTYQKWLRPASYNSLAPVATAGIPIDDSLVNPGGTIARFRGQLDWELSPAWFVTGFADRKSVDNLTSSEGNVLNTRADLANLDRLRQRSVANLAAPDQLEAAPSFSRGTASIGGFAVNHVFSRNLAANFGYANTHSENTSATYQGNMIPYLPVHRATIGLTWAGDQRIVVGAQAVWRSARFMDEANLVPLAAGWDMTVQLHWESEDKRWNVEGYAVNLLKRDVEHLLGVNFIARF
jgi:Flp pilus assembly protein TadD